MTISEYGMAVEELFAANRRTRQFWLSIQIIGMILILSTQLTCIFFTDIETFYLNLFPVAMIVYGVFFVARNEVQSKVFGKKYDALKEKFNSRIDAKELNASCSACKRIIED